MAASSDDNYYKTTFERNAEGNLCGIKTVVGDGDIEIDYRLDPYNKIPFFIRGDNPRPSIASFEDPDLDLDPTLVDNLKNAKVWNLTPIQRHAIPQLMAKSDVMCCSHTGSGKTAVFLAPIISMILWEKENSTKQYVGRNMSRPRSLVLAPTRELAIQICDYAVMLCNGLPLNCMVVYGGDSFQHELSALRRHPADILVATPGRLIHLLSSTDAVSLSETMYFVVDEADEMFDRGFFQEIREIVDNYMKPKEERVTALFSATFPHQIQTFARRQLRKNHIFVVIGILGGASPDVAQSIIPVSRYEKRSRLSKMIAVAAADSTKLLVFCNTIETVDLVANYLKEDEVASASLHSFHSQYDRLQALEDFNCGRVQVLVATSVAARGLHIPSVHTVLNFDLPKNINDYVQRIGRTGRIGSVGEAVSFFDEDEDKDLAPDLRMTLGSVNQSIPSFLFEDTTKDTLENDEDYKNANVDIKRKAKKSEFNFKEILEYKKDEWF